MMHWITPAQASLCRRIFENLCHPVFILFVCVVGLALYLAWKSTSWSLRIVALCTVFLLFLLSTPWLPEYLISNLQKQYQPVKEVDQRVHWIVVLGGGVNEVEHLPIGEALSVSSIRRVFEGVRLKEQLPHATLLFSGGSVNGIQYAVGQKMHELGDVLLGSSTQDKVENDSMNTADEVEKIQEILGDEPFYLVTSALHMRRSMGLFLHAGMHPIPAPCDYIYFWTKKESMALYIPGAYNLAYFNKVWHEILGLFWARMRGLV